MIAASIPDGWVMTSTATLEAVSSTSEFSACVTITGNACPGDLDFDGDVDLADLSRLLAAYDDCDGDPNYDPAADLDDSGCVDLADLAQLLGVYGEPCP